MWKTRMTVNLLSMLLTRSHALTYTLFIFALISPGVNRLPEAIPECEISVVVSVTVSYGLHVNSAALEMA